MAIEGLNTEALKAGYIKLPTYQKLLITVVVLAVAGGLYYYFSYMPKQAVLKSLDIKITGMKSELSQSKAVADDLPRFEAESKIMNEKLTIALTKLPSSDEIPTLLKNMESLANDSGVNFKSLKMMKDVSKGFYAEVPVILQLTGSYHDTAQFFDKLSRLPRIINISGLVIGSPKKVGGKLKLNINCMATTYKFLGS